MRLDNRIRWRLDDGTWSALFLAMLLLYVLRFMWSGLFRTWYFSSDEYVVGAEVIRFAEKDFNQHFFDMPGTPFIFLGSIVWFFVYAACAIIDEGIGRTGIQSFTFGHLPAFFATVRGMTLFMFCLSVLLLFWLTAKLTSTAAARLAALLLAMSPIYTSYSSFIRVESMSVCLVLGALLCVVYAAEARQAPCLHPFFDLVFLGGILAGVGAAARLHSMTMSLPVLLMMLVLSPTAPPPEDYPPWVKAAGICVACALILAGAALTL